jgi:hypothetical protein
MIHKRIKFAAVARQSVVPVMPEHHHPKPFTHFGYGPVKSSIKFIFENLEFRNHPFANGLPKNNKLPIHGLIANVGKTKKVKCLWFTFAPMPAVLSRKSPKLDNSGLAAVKLQIELSKTLYQVFVEPLGIFSVLKANHKIIAKSDNSDISTVVLFSPFIRPQIKHVVQINVRQQRTDQSHAR